MKKILTIALAAMMVLSLAACGGEKNPGSSSTDPVEPPASSSVVENQTDPAIDENDASDIESEDPEDIAESDVSEDVESDTSEVEDDEAEADESADETEDGDEAVSSEAAEGGRKAGRNETNDSESVWSDLFMRMII